ncbi:cytochrome P450 2J2-like [Rhinoraja longicauda]
MGGVRSMLDLPPLRWLPWLDLPTFLVFLMVFLGLAALRKLWVDRHLPPGPPMWTLAANVFLGSKAPHLALTELSQQYGNILTCYVFGMPMVALNGYQIIQEALVQHGREFADRPYIALLEDLSKGQGIILAHYGRSWKQQRRFTLTVLRNFGLGKIAFEENILEEVQYLTNVFKASEGRPFNPGPKITSAVSNVICSVVMGRRFHYEDKTFTRLVELLEENLVLQTTAWAMMYSVVPFFGYFPGPHQKIFKNQRSIEAILQGFIDQHRETRSGETIRDFIDAYLQEMEKEQGCKTSCMTEGNLLHNVIDLFIAGTETTTNTLQWGLLIMMLYPDIQERCQREIAEVIGWTRAPSMEDGPNMPYLSAVIHEVQRFGNIVPLAAGHTTFEDVTFRGYRLKKKTLVIINLASVLSDETQWKYPKEFNPENFLNEKGEFFKPDAFVPFSMGLRACPGEKLAKMELFLFFTSLLRDFEFYWPDPATTPSLQPVYKVTLGPRPYKLGIRCRKAPGNGATLPSD